MSEPVFKTNLLRMVVLAGPNGSGKSTLTDGLKIDQPFPSLYINADDISRTELGHITDPLKRNLEAANLAERRRHNALTSGQPFAFETVMSTPGKLALFDEARAKGYHVDLIFVTTEDVAINQVRVENRVAKGGHFVDPDKIAERYERTMQLLPSAIDKANSAEVYDNSVTGKRPLRVAWKDETRITFADTYPDWVKERLVQPIQQRHASRQHLTSELNSIHPDATISDAYIGDGQCYNGQIIRITEQHILQRTRGSENHFVYHDRLLCAPLAFQIGKDMAIAYHFGADGKHV